MTTPTMVQHCEAKGRRKCGRIGRTWARVSYQMYAVTSTRVLAHCDGCLAAVPVADHIGPVTVMPTARA